MPDDKAARRLVEHLTMLRDYWVGLGKSPAETADGLLFSVFSTLDGCNCAMPAFHLVPDLGLAEGEEPDETLHEHFKDGESINGHVMLHEIYSMEENMKRKKAEGKKVLPRVRA